MTSEGVASVPEGTLDLEVEAEVVAEAAVDNRRAIMASLPRMVRTKSNLRHLPPLVEAVVEEAVVAVDPTVDPMTRGTPTTSTATRKSTNPWKPSLRLCQRGRRRR